MKSIEDSDSPVYPQFQTPWSHRWIWRMEDSSESMCTAILLPFLQCCNRRNHFQISTNDPHTMVLWRTCSVDTYNLFYMPVYTEKKISHTYMPIDHPLIMMREHNHISWISLPLPHSSPPIAPRYLATAWLRHESLQHNFVSLSPRHLQYVISKLKYYAQIVIWLSLTTSQYITLWSFIFLFF